MSDASARLSVLVTGASSGIGLHIAQTLAQAGHLVWAGVRQGADAERLSATPGLRPLLLDVRDEAAIAAAVATIEAEGAGLQGLVNTAGVGDLGPLAAWSAADLHRLFDINVYGPHRLSNALLPLLLASPGSRIVNIGSQGGSITSSGFGPYTMSKHALEAYSEALRLELAPLGVSVSIVQPGGVRSEIGAKSQAANVARLQATPAPLQPLAQQMLAALSAPEAPFRPDEPESAANRRLSEPALVSEAVQHALCSPSPQRRYLVGTRWEGERVIDALLQRLLDANDSPSLGFSLDELTQRLREHAARKR